VIELLNNAQMGSGENSKLECLKIVQEIIVHKVKAVLRIHDILVWILIRGAMPLTNGSGSFNFYH
jgi:hypothetical protein